MNFAHNILDKERRLFPRVKAGFPVQLSFELNGENQVFDASATRISLVSVELEGSGEIIMGFKTQNELPSTCMLEFTLPGSDVAMSIKCQLLSYRRLSEHVYAISLNYYQFGLGESAQIAIRDYLSENF